MFSACSLFIVAMCIVAVVIIATFIEDTVNIRGYWSDPSKYCARSSTSSIRIVGNHTVVNIHPADEYDPFWIQKVTKNNEASLDDDTSTLADHLPSSSPVVVLPWLDSGWSRILHYGHYLIDGLNESKVLHHTTTMFDVSPQVVWMCDIGPPAYKVWWGEEGACHQLKLQIQRVQQVRRTLGIAMHWPVYLIHFGDWPGEERCEDIEALMPPGLVKYARRSLVMGRQWNGSAQAIVPGALVRANRLMVHAPLTVRTDIVRDMAACLNEAYNASLEYPLENLKRAIDVAHFWPVAKPKTFGLDPFASRLRATVSIYLSGWGKNTTYNIFIGVVGQPHKEGRASPQRAYIEKMLGTKIIVLTQKDKWEDHFRLMEALVSGAMVIQDQMLLLPDGLKNGTHMIEFQGIEELPSLLDYYLNNEQERLEIAHRGRELAMTKHRGWHRMESIVFGKSASVCREGKPTSSCPYYVTPEDDA